MHIYKICTLLRFYEELVKFLYFDFFDNLVRDLFWLFGFKWVVSSYLTQLFYFIKKLALQTNEIKR